MGWSRTSLLRCRAPNPVRHRAKFQLHLQRQSGRYQAGGPDLGVRYVLEGSVRKAGNRVRIDRRS